MEAPSTKLFVEKFRKEYPFICKMLTRQLDSIDKDIKKENVPATIWAAFHQALANDIQLNITTHHSDTNTIEIRFGNLPLGAKFFNCGKQYTKVNEVFNRAHQGNAIAVISGQEKKFLMDDVCMVSKEQGQTIG